MCTSSIHVAVLSLHIFLTLYVTHFNPSEGVLDVQTLQQIILNESAMTILGSPPL